MLRLYDLWSDHSKIPCIATSICRIDTSETGKLDVMMRAMLKHLLGGLSLIVVWSTTALAIKWSVGGMPYALALFSRFGIAFIVMATLLALHRTKLPPVRTTWQAWLASGGSTAFTMLCTYWASQYVASGLVAIIHGLAPLATVVFARILLHEKASRNEIGGIILAVIGLVVIFSNHLHLGPEGLPALLLVLFAVTLNSGAAVKLKEYSQGLPAVVVSVGAMGVCTVSTGTLWLAQGAPLPDVLPLRAAGAILYLAIVATVFALSVYYWLIRECRPTQIALIPMIATASSIWIGHTLNHEVVTREIMIGSSLIIGGLALNQLGALRQKR
jgi:drug/metabolite transporter (DMT)-like permease